MSFMKGRLAFALALLIVVLGFSAPMAQAQTLTPAVANDLLSAFEELEQDNFAEGLVKLNALMTRRGDRMSDFDRASVLQIRGSAHVQLEDFDAAIRDFLTALRLEALPSDQNDRLRFNLAQLYYATEQYRESINLFNDWLDSGGVATESTFFMLAGAHYQLSELEDALRNIRQAMELSSEPNRRNYEFKNVVLNDLNRVVERTELMKQMVALWPDVLSFWRQLVGLYLDQDDQRNAFSAAESAYIAGLTESENDIRLLAEFYSTFNNPYRGARLLETEMERGRVERNVGNLRLLSQLWSQAREHEKAIPVLREAAGMAETGDLYFRLGQSLLANENNADAERALMNALDVGGLSEANRADAWLLIGTARFNQAEPGDRSQRTRADQAFQEAARFQQTANQARSWREYIRAVNETETRQALLEQEQQERLAEAAEERFLQSCRALQIAGRTLSPECQEALEREQEALDAPLEEDAE